MTPLVSRSAQLIQHGFLASVLLASTLTGCAPAAAPTPSKTASLSTEPASPSPSQPVPTAAASATGTAQLHPPAAPGTSPSSGPIPAALGTWAPSAPPACSPQVIDGPGGLALMIGDSSIPLPAPHFSPLPSAELTVTPFNDRSVLLSHRYTEHVNPLTAGLWLVECEAPHRTVETYRREDVNFAYSLTDTEGRWLYHQSPDGLSRLDLKSLNSEKTRVEVVLPRQPDYRPDCWGRAELRKTSDQPIRWLVPNQEMLLHRIANCGFEGHPEAQRIALTLPALPQDSPSSRTLSPVTTVVLDAKKRLWVGDGAKCESPGAMDPNGHGHLWMSEDKGQSWHPMPFGGTGGMSQLATRGTQLVGLTQVCDGMMLRGGDLHASWDGGKTWKKFAADASLFAPNTDQEGPLFEQFQVLSWTPLKLRTWRNSHTDPNVDETWEAPFTKTRPGVMPQAGSVWRQVRSRPRPRRTDQVAAVGARKFETSESGLLVTVAGKQQLSFRTIDWWRGLDWRGNEDQDEEEPPSFKPAHSSFPRRGCFKKPRLTRSTLSVIGVSPLDHLNLRRTASPFSQAISQVPFDADNLKPTGHICRYRGRTWLQVVADGAPGWANAEYLSGVTPPKEATARIKQLTPTTSSTPSALAAQVARAIDTAHGPQTESSFSTRVLGVKTTGHQSYALLQSCCELDDSISGRQYRLNMKRMGTTWSLDFATARIICRRGTNQNGTLCS